MSRVLTTLLVLATLAPMGAVEAQKLEVTSLRTIPGGSEGMVSLEWGSGEAVSESGAKVEFELLVDGDGQPSGYRLAEAAVRELKAGERIPFFIRSLETRSAGFGRPATDRSGAPLLATMSYPSVRGAWKTVTIESVGQVGDEIRVSVREELQLADGRAIKELRFRSEEAYLIDVP